MKILTTRIFFLLAALTLLQHANSAEPDSWQPLLVAVEKIEITPTVGNRVSQSMKGPAKVESVHDPIFARILYLRSGEQSLVMVSLDLLELGTENLKRAINKNTRIDNLLISYTHSHSGFLEQNSMEKLATRIVKAIDRAKENLQPSQVAFGSRNIDEVYNRRVAKEDGSVEMLWENPERILSPASDSSLNIISFTTSKGAPLAALVNYSAHPVITMDFINVVVSADYPGVLLKQLDSQYGGINMFVLGAAGDLNPYWAGAKPENKNFDKMKQMGEVLAKESMELLTEMAGHRSSAFLGFSRETINLDIHNQQVNLPVYAMKFSPELALVALPGELFSELGLDIKKQSPFKHTLVMAYTESIGYVPNQKAIAQGGYGATEAVRVKAGSGERLVDAAVKALKKL